MFFLLYTCDIIMQNSINMIIQLYSKCRLEIFRSDGVSVVLWRKYGSLQLRVGRTLHGRTKHISSRLHSPLHCQLFSVVTGAIVVLSFPTNNSVIFFPTFGVCI